MEATECTADYKYSMQKIATSSVVKVCVYSLPLDCAQSVHADNIFSISGTLKVGLESIEAQFCAKGLFKQLNFANW